MKRLAILAAVVLCSVPTLAGEYLINEEIAYGLRVTFSEPVMLTYFGDVLTQVSPEGEATEFVFSGSELPAWVGHGLAWTPARARILDYAWLQLGDLDSGLPGDATAEDYEYEISLPNLGTTLTVHRHIDRKQMPFSVQYEVSGTESLERYVLAWDVDKYVDADGNGDPQDDREYSGEHLQLIFFEDYNPTITLHVTDSTDVEVATWENMIRNDFLVGDSISLDGAMLSGGGLERGESAYWSQVHMEKMDLEYASEYESTLEDAGTETAEATHRSPGKYVYELRLSVEEGSVVLGRVSTWVVERKTYDKRAGLLMADLWNEEYDAATNRMLDVSGFFSDADATAKLDWLGQQGFDEIVVMNIHPMVDIAPLPEIVEVGPMHRIGPEDVAMVFSHIPTGHIAWLTFSFVGMDGEAEVDPWYWADVENRDLEYYKEFFRQYVPMVLEEARQAEELGLASISLGWGHPYLRYLPRIRAQDWSTGEWIADQWISLIRQVKAVFSGQVGLGFLWSEDAEEEVVAEADFVAMSLQNYKDAQLFLGDADSVEELRIQYEKYITYLVDPTYERFQKPIRYTFWANSFEGAASSWRDFENYVYGTWRREFALGGHSEEILSGQATPQLVPDFREQVRMVEAIMPALASNPHVFFIVPQFEYWKLLSFNDFAPSNVIDYFNVVTGSLQGKPAFQAFRLWASMFSQSDRLLYRHEIPVCGQETVVASDSCPETHGDWAEFPFVYQVADGWAPGVYWYDGRNRPLAESEHWELPGHEISAIGLEFHDQGLDVHWLGRHADLRSNFNYQLWFRHPDKDITLFVEIDAKDAIVYLTSRIDDEWQQLDPDGVCYIVENSELSTYLPNFTLPSGDPLQDLRAWRIEAFIIYQVPGGEYYKIFDGITYDSRVN